MKRLFSLTLCLLAAITMYAQSELPSTEIKDLKSSKKIAFNKTIEPGKVTLVSFWATWCVPCKKEIKNFKEKLPEWQKEVSFNYMTISIDESRAENMARGYAQNQGWDFPFYIDPNGDLKRSLNFQNVPFTLIIDKSGKVVFNHQGYEEGGEEEIFAKLKELSK